MASTYTLNNGIELIGTGEQSGTWGDTTNTNLELLDTALDGQVTITASSAGNSGSPNSLPITDGAASNGRNRLINITSGSDLGATVFYQLTPNDAEKIVYIRNSLNAQDLIVFQGTYNSSNDYLIPNGTTAVVFFNGAGSGAVAANVFNNAHFDAMNVVGNVTITTDDNSTQLTLISTDADASVGPKLELYRNSGSPADDDTLGFVTFKGRNDNSQDVVYAELQSYIIDASDGTEDGYLVIDTMLGGTARERITLNNTTTVFNEEGEDIDFRVESDTKTHMIAVDAANDALGIAMVPDTGVRLSVNGQIGPTNGDASAPTYTFYSDPDTGMFRAAANTLGLTAGTVEQFRMSASGGITVNNAQNANVNFIVKSGSNSNAFQVDGSSGAVTINEAGIDIDTRIEGNNNANLFYVDAGNDRVAIGHNVPRAKLDIMGQGTSATNLSMLIGSDEGATVNPSRTNSTDKAMRMGLPHYNTAQSATALMVASSTSGANSIFIGGGTSVMNAATQVHIYAADNTTTATGVSRVQVTGSEMTVNENSGDFDFRVESDSSTHAFFVEGNDGGGTPSIGFGTSDPTKLGTSGTAALGGGSGAIVQLAGDDCQIRMANHVIHSDNSSNTIFHIRNNYGLTNSGAELSLESGHITFNVGTSFTEKMRVHPAGNVKMGENTGTLNDDAPLEVERNESSNDTCIRTKHPSTNPRFHIDFLNSSGTQGNVTVNSGSVNFNSTSDYRKKENVNYTWDGTTDLKRLKPAKFNFIGNSDTVQGFLAHEVSSVVPIAVTGEKDAVDADGNPKYQSMDASKLVPLLVKTIQELEARITALENA